MNFEIFFALIGLPILILVTAILCYVHTGIKEEISSMKRELKENTQSNQSTRKGEAS